MKTALVATNHPATIAAALYQLVDEHSDWYVIVDRVTYDQLDTEKRPHLVQANAYTGLDLTPGDPFELVHWKFLEAITGQPSELSPIVDLLYVEKDCRRGQVPVGQILWTTAQAAEPDARITIITQPNDLKIFVEQAE